MNQETVNARNSIISTARSNESVASDIYTTIVNLLSKLEPVVLEKCSEEDYMSGDDVMTIQERTGLILSSALGKLHKLHTVVGESASLSVGTSGSTYSKAGSVGYADVKPSRIMSSTLDTKGYR